METELRTHVVAVARAYSASTGRALTTIAKHDIGIDSGWLRHVEAGGTFKVGTYDRVIGWFAEHWPAGLPWPRPPSLRDAIPRPAPRGTRR
jgi:hypothetical protein